MGKGIVTMKNEDYRDMINQAFYMLLEDISNHEIYRKHKFVNSGYAAFDIEREDEEYITPKYCMYSYSFKVNKIPNWKFGVWLYRPSAKDGCFDGRGNVERIKGVWFCAEDKFIDKFKPTRTYFSGDFRVDLEDHTVTYEGYPCCDLGDAIEFIEHNKYVASIYDDHGWCGCQYFYVSKVSAFFKCCKKYLHQWKEEVVTKFLDSRVLKICQNEFLKDFGEDGSVKNGYIYDRGDNWSPRYEMRCPYKDNKEWAIDGPGWYFYQDDTREWFEKKTKPLKFLAKVFGVYYYIPIELETYVYEEK
jgi:hypothetical protein